MPTPSTPAKAIELFYSYAHEDEGLRNELEKQLSILKRKGILQEWRDRHILPGTEWKGIIDERLESAAIILLLVSPDFLASDYAYQIEMKRALQRHDAGSACVIPVILRPVDWQGAPFSKLQALPQDARPITSWPNQDEAFLNVARGIRKTVEELLASRAGDSTATIQPRVWNIPHRRNPNFTGREQLLNDLRAALISSTTTALTQAITGLGGVGKTQTATEYAYRFDTDYDVVWWIRAEEPATLASDYAGLAAELQLPQKDYKEQDLIVKTVYRWLEQNGKWLLIFDNAQQAADLGAYIPMKAAGHILITSRNPNWGNIAQRLPVRRWERSESVEFLLRRTGHEDVAMAATLADALGDLPLALAQAAAYIDETGLSLSSYLDLFQLRQRELLSSGQPSPDYPYTVATTWDLSFKRVSDQSPAAADLLRMCAFFAPDDIPFTLIANAADRLPARLQLVAQNPLLMGEAVATLRRYSLLEARDDSLSIHRLVQTVMRDRMTETDGRMWVLAAVKIISAAFPEHGEDATLWRLSSRLFPHAEAALTHAEKLSPEPETKGKLLNRLGRYLFGRAEFGAARGYFERALSSDEAVYGSSNSVIATDLNDLGLALQNAGDLRNARQHLERALSIDQEVNGSVHSDVARDLSNLGNLLIELGHPQSAKDHLERAIMIDEEVNGPHHPDVARDLNNLGNALREMGDPRAAKEHLERALKIATAVYGPDHPKVAASLNNLGNTLRELGYPRIAYEHLERALMIDEAIYGPNHPKVAVDLNDLGNALRDLDEPRSAKEHLERALMIDEVIYGPNHFTVAGDLNNLGNALCELGDPRGAKEHIERALRIGEAVYGPNHPKIATAFNSLGNALREMGEPRLSKVHLERAVKIDEAVYGPNHLKVARDLHNLGSILAYMDIHPAAQTYLERAYLMWTRLLGKNHPSTIRARQNLNAVRVRHGFRPVRGSVQKKKGKRKK